MNDRFMLNDEDNLMFMTEPGVWMQFDCYDIIDDEIYLYYKGQNIAVLRDLDSMDFRTHVHDYDDQFENDGGYEE